jgi:hypothetical protein
LSLRSRSRKRSSTDFFTVKIACAASVIVTVVPRSTGSPSAHRAGAVNLEPRATYWISPTPFAGIGVITCASRPTSRYTSASLVASVAAKILLNTLIEAHAPPAPSPRLGNRLNGPSGIGFVRMTPVSPKHVKNIATIIGLNGPNCVSDPSNAASSPCSAPWPTSWPTSTS